MIPLKDDNFKVDPNPVSITLISDWSMWLQKCPSRRFEGWDKVRIKFQHGLRQMILLCWDLISSSRNVGLPGASHLSLVVKNLPANAEVLVSCRSCLYTLTIIPLSDICSENISSHSVGCLFTFQIMPFETQKFLFLMKFSFFFFCCFCF